MSFALLIYLVAASVVAAVNFGRWWVDRRHPRRVSPSSPTACARFDVATETEQERTRRMLAELAQVNAQQDHPMCRDTRITALLRRWDQEHAQRQGIRWRPRPTWSSSKWPSVVGGIATLLALPILFVVGEQFEWRAVDAFVPAVNVELVATALAGVAVVVFALFVGSFVLTGHIQITLVPRKTVFSAFVVACLFVLGTYQSTFAWIATTGWLLGKRMQFDAMVVTTESPAEPDCGNVITIEFLYGTHARCTSRLWTGTPPVPRQMVRLTGKASRLGYYIERMEPVQPRP